MATPRDDRRAQRGSVEDRPADLVSQPLIIQDEFANHIRELFALPTALEPADALTLPPGSRRTRGLDRVGRSTKLVRGDMRHHRRLTGLHETAPWNEYSYGVSDRGASVRIPWQVEVEKKGYIEDRRPNANVDPYIVTRLIVNTCCSALEEAEQV